MKSILKKWKGKKKPKWHHIINGVLWEYYHLFLLYALWCPLSISNGDDTHFFTLIKTWNQLACGELTHSRKLAAHVRINYIQLINKLSNKFYAKQKIQWFLSIFFFVSLFNLHLFHEGYRNKLIITSSMIRCASLFFFL